MFHFSTFSFVFCDIFSVKSPTFQDPTVQAGVGLTDAKDPRGAWCYVAPGQCPDEERSMVFPQRFLSYKVCSYLMEPGKKCTKKSQSGRF